MQFGKGARGAWSFLRHPGLSLRLASYLAAEDGTSLGHWLNRILSVEQRRRLAMTVLGGDEVIVEFQRDGVRWAVPPGDPISTGLLVDGEYAGLGELLPALAWLDNNTDRRGGTVVEIGANIGSTTVPLAAQGMRVVAIEPVPFTFEILTRNVHANDLADRVDLVQLAVSASTTTVPMAVEGSWHCTSRIVDKASKTTIDVPAMGLTDLVASRGVDPADIRFVWCDAEGSEDDAMETGAALWAAGVPLFAEFGLADLSEVAGRHFRGFISSRAIRTEGPTARLRPIEELAADHLEMVMYMP